jgi:colicin import membrane protein
MTAALYALTLHAVIIALLVVGFRIARRDSAATPVMQAVVVREAPEQKQDQKPEQKQEQEKARQEEERRRREAEQQRVEAERKKQDELKKEEEAQRKKQAEVEKKKQQEAERKKAEKQRQQQAEQTLREQLAEEEKARASARSAKRATEADKYKAAIRQKVERNWVRPAASRKGLQCTVRVRLIPGGEVLEAKVVRSSGDAVFDRSVESAVHKSSPLPLPEDAELFEHFRDIEFIFRPEE